MTLHAARLLPYVLCGVQAAANLAAPGAGAAPAQPPVPTAAPPGLSPADVVALTDKSGLPAGEALTRRKLGVLNFLASAPACIPPCSP
jgi:hypothetical protein